MDEIEITSIVRETNQGQTAPYLCTGDDGKKYVVKGSKATYQGLINEWVVANLADGFGLPIPTYKKAYADEQLYAYGVYDLYSYNFASEFHPNVQEVRFSQLSEIEQRLLKDLYVFDYWVCNNDRCLTEHGGNPNFFLNQKTLEPLVLDHNLSFDKSFCGQLHKELHLGAIAWTGLDLVDKQHYEERMQQALQRLDYAITSLPEDWLEDKSRDSIKEEIEVVLQRYTSCEFWEGM